MTDTETARANTSSARAAVASDAEPLSQSLARAFHDDPLMEYLFRDAPPKAAGQVAQGVSAACSSSACRTAGAR